jgi:hypothetical protein
MRLCCHLGSLVGQVGPATSIGIGQKVAGCRAVGRERGRRRTNRRSGDSVGHMAGSAQRGEQRQNERCVDQRQSQQLLYDQQQAAPWWPPSSCRLAGRWAFGYAERCWSLAVRGQMPIQCSSPAFGRGIPGPGLGPVRLPRVDIHLAPATTGHRNIPDSQYIKMACERGRLEQPLQER